MNLQEVDVGDVQDGETWIFQHILTKEAHESGIFPRKNPHIGDIERK